MTVWTDDELGRIGAAQELEIAPFGAAGSTRRPTTIWVVRVGDELFVRSYHGRTGGWFSRALRSHEGHIRAGGVERDVRLLEPDAELRNEVDEAYRAKYASYGAAYLDPMISDAASAATLRLTPR
jgi:hypothetical protein